MKIRFFSYAAILMGFEYFSVMAIEPINISPYRKQGYFPEPGGAFYPPAPPVPISIWRKLSLPEPGGAFYPPAPPVQASNWRDLSKMPEPGGAFGKIVLEGHNSSEKRAVVPSKTDSNKPEKSKTLKELGKELKGFGKDLLNIVK